MEETKVEETFHQVLLRVAGECRFIGMLSLRGATGAWGTLLVEEHHGAGAKQALAKSLWCWLTGHARTGW